MLHRGPDSFGAWWSNNGEVAFGHRRLSIMDLTSAGNQPMTLPELGLTIVFNGEIYNFLELKSQLACDHLQWKTRGGFYASAKGSRQFDEGNRAEAPVNIEKPSANSLQPFDEWRGTSDTEVLLAAYAKWGTDCLRHLNGMFAFAIYDERKRQLFLARDRVGEKPLFFRLENGKLWFASELKALMAVPGLPRKISPDAFDCYLAFGYVPGEMCILEGYRKLPPAHAMTYDLDQGTHWIWQWWRPPPFEGAGVSGQVEDEQLVDELEKLLEDAVARQMVADVPVGILLSGGVDSSLVTAMTARKSSKVKTFTIGFPGAGKLDETAHARLIAMHFGTDHNELMAQPATADLIPILARQFDEPIIDSSMIPTFLVSRLVRQHCTVALGGDGGDELFAGYGHYSRLLWMQRWFRFIPGWLRRGVANSAEKILPVGLKGRNYLQGIDVELDRGLPALTGHFDLTMRKKLLPSYKSGKFLAEEVWRSQIPMENELLQRATRMDFSGYLAEDILVKLDRASMLNSLEVRAPLLDYRVVEFAFGKVPSRLKANQDKKKILLKRLAERVLPTEFDKKRKQGFSIPLADWLKTGPFRKLFLDTLTSEGCLFNAKTIKGLFNGQDAGLRNGERLFGLVVFEIWRKTYNVGL